MIRELIASILARYDYAIQDATVRIRLREQNLAKFGEIVFEDVKAFMQEFANADKRVSIEERNRGFFVLFNGVNLFRVGVSVYSTRAEIVVDREPVVRYDGIDSSVTENYTDDCKPSVVIKNRIMQTFEKTVRDYLEREINKI